MPGWHRSQLLLTKTCNLVRTDLLTNSDRTPKQLGQCDLLYGSKSLTEESVHEYIFQASWDSQPIITFQGSYSAWKILENAWIMFLKFKALESAWKQGRSLKVLEKSLHFLSGSAWKIVFHYKLWMWVADCVVHLLKCHTTTM